MENSQIDERQIARKEKIGHIDNDPVFAIATTGGFNMVVAVRNGKSEVISVGPHPAVARHLAKKREAKLVITELSKSEWVNPRDFEYLLTKYEALTDEFRKAQGL